MKRTVKNVVALITVLLLVFIAACAPAPEGVTPAPTPEEITPPPTAEPTPPPIPEPTPIPTAMPEANFRFLISDEENAIGHFESLSVNITSVGVHKGGEAGGWLEFPPATQWLDLVPLQEENAQEIWSGNLADGQYTMVFIYVSDIDAELKSGNSTEVKLPSDKLRINTNFNIPEDSPVSFVFDLSVIAAGSERSGIKYILKPVVSQSGPNQEFVGVSPLEGGESEIEPQEELEGELTLEIVGGNVTPGENVTLMVTFDGEPVAGAEVEVNDEKVDDTGDDGTVSFTIPEDADELEIEAKKGELKGELEIELQEELGGEPEVELQEELESELTLEIVGGNVTPGENVTLLVTFDGEPVAGARVEVNDEEIDNTGDDGTVSFTIPEDADELEIEVKKEELKGELEIEFEEE